MTSVYGISFDLPSSLTDTTSYSFTSPEGPILQLLIDFDSGPPSNVDPWLERCREDVGELEGAKVGPTRRYDNPELAPRGFEASFGEGEKRRVRPVIGIAAEQEWLRIVPKCKPGFEPILEHLLRTFRRSEGIPSLDPAPLANGRLLYRVRGYSFESLQYFDAPRAYTFESADRSARLYAFRGKEPPVFEEPDWDRFALAPDALITASLSSGGKIVGRENPPAPSPIFTARHSLCLAEEGPSSRQLVYAQAVTEVAGTFFYLVLAREGPSEESLELWKSLLSSARRD